MQKLIITKIGSNLRIKISQVQVHMIVVIGKSNMKTAVLPRKTQNTVVAVGAVGAQWWSRGLACQKL